MRSVVPASVTRRFRILFWRLFGHLLAKLLNRRNRFYVRRACGISLGIFWMASAVVAAELRPVDGSSPLFRVFVSGSSGGSNAPIDLAGKQPLLVVSSLANIQLSRDRKALRLTLTAADARRFADITRKHAHNLLILEANGKVLEAMSAASPVTNGILEFTYPDDAPVADYLKRRFRLK